MELRSRDSHPIFIDLLSTLKSLRDPLQTTKKHQKDDKILENPGSFEGKTPRRSLGSGSFGHARSDSSSWTWTPSASASRNWSVKTAMETNLGRLEAPSEDLLEELLKVCLDKGMIWNLNITEWHIINKVLLMNHNDLAIKEKQDVNVQWFNLLSILTYIMPSNGVEDSWGDDPQGWKSAGVRSSWKLVSERRCRASATSKNGSHYT